MNRKCGLSIVVVALFLLNAGCAWQRIPPSPVYQESTSIPLGIGIQLADDPATAAYGPIIIKHLKDWRLFRSVTFPYRQGDVVDAVLVMKIQGGWTPDSSNFGKGFLIGLSLYTLSPVIGPGMTGRHDVNAILQKEMKELAQYGIHEETHVEWGLGADTGQVSEKSDDLQTMTLAFKLAEAIRKDWPTLSEQFGKFNPIPLLQSNEGGFAVERGARTRIEQGGIRTERQVRNFILRYHVYLTADISRGQGEYLSSLYTMLRLPESVETLKRLRSIAARNQEALSFAEVILMQYPVDDPAAPPQGQKTNRGRR